MTGQRWGVMLCEALGLDKNVVRSVTLTATVNEAASVVVEQWLTDDQGRRIAELLTTRYCLVEDGGGS